jgi:hypothetical protein
MPGAAASSSLTFEETVMAVDAAGLGSITDSGDDMLLKKDIGIIGLLFTALHSIIESLEAPASPDTPERFTPSNFTSRGDKRMIKWEQ